MKKFFLTAAVVASTLLAFAATPVTVNEKVLSSFSKSFQHANNIVWSEHNDHYVVRFLQGTIDSRVKYDLKGNVLETVRYYNEESLPMFIKSKLQDKFTGKKVFGVTEIAKDGELNYYIILEDAKNYITVKSDYFGNTAVLTKLKKANS